MLTEAIIAAIAAGAGAIITGIGTITVQIIKAKKTKTEDKELEFNHTENLVRLTTSMTDVNETINNLKNEIMPMLNGLSKDVDRIDKKLESFHTEWKDYNIVMLRHDITSVYQHYKDSAAIPQGIYQSTMELYDKYSKLGGNSYIKEIVEEMKEWKKV